MARTRTHRYGFMILAALGSLAALPLGTAMGSPIPTRITYSTQWPGPMPGVAGGPPVFEFQGVQNQTATLGSVMKLGTVLVHQTLPGRIYFDGSRVPVDFLVTAIDGKNIDSIRPQVTLDGVIYGAVYPEGTVAAGFSFQGMYDRFDLGGEMLSSFRAGDLTLTLGPPRSDDGRLSNMAPGTPVVAVDVYGVFTAAPVPEPGTWLVALGGAAFFASTYRRRRTKAA